MITESLNFSRVGAYQAKKSKRIIPLSFSVYFWAVTFLALCGLADSIYLSISHYRVYTDIGYRSFCAVSKSINCDTVSQSPFSIFFGLPVPFWGIIGYVFFLLLLSFAWNQRREKKRIWPVLFLVSLAFSLYSIILALISSSYIHSYCIMCIVSYGVNFALLYSCWLIRRRFDDTGLFDGLIRDIRFLMKNKMRCLSLFSPFLLGIILIGIYFPNYWELSCPPISAEIHRGITEEGHPWIGAEHPDLVIEEFTDYQCFQCKKMHFFLRGLVAEYPDKIRLVHRHYPMDHKFNPIVKEPFHVGSGKLALLATYAATQNKFWEMNDLLFEVVREKESLNVKELAEKVGLDPRGLAGSLYDRNILLRLNKDIRAGMKLEIAGTPGYVIDGKVYLAQIPPEILKKVMN